MKTTTVDAYRDDLAKYVRLHGDIWNVLWAHKSIGRIAVAVQPSAARLGETVKIAGDIVRDEPSERPAGWNDQWRESVLAEVKQIIAALSLPGDVFPAMTPPRFVHGQSQGICDLFGSRPELQPDGNVFAHPLPPDPKFIDAVVPLPIERSMYWGAVEWVRYARRCTRGLYSFRSPIMTGPFDTANYLLSTTTLLEWVYTEPETLHRLLTKITDVICAMLAALKDAAGGMLNSPHHFCCVRGGYDFASECRSLVSREIYETFEAPYLRRIGERHGPFAIHSCGSWERTIPSALADPNLRAMHGQIRENDLKELCALAQGRILFGIGRSANLPPVYTWPDAESFYAFVLETVPPAQPLEIHIAEEELPLWNALCAKWGHSESKCGV